MRRNDREISKTEDIIKIINKCKVLRLAMNTDDGIYNVPLNFGFEYSNNTFVFYIHCAKEGKKIDALKEFPNVCIEADCSHQLVSGNNACNYSYLYQSIIAQGKAEILCEELKKAKALELIMKHQTGKEFQITPQQASSVAIIKITIDCITAKAHLK